MEGLGLPRMWWTGGRVALTWTGPLQLTADDRTWPGIAQVVHLPGEGGRAIGALQRGDDTLTWEACWDVVGDASACPFPSPF